jgi:hypothetical protein
MMPSILILQINKSRPMVIRSGLNSSSLREWTLPEFCTYGQ